MSSGTLVNFSHSALSAHGFGAQLNMLDIKMSSSLSPVAPVNILPECCIGMWDAEMAHPPPTKLETTDIMDLIEPSMSNTSLPNASCIEPGSTSPTTIIHHTGDATIRRHHNHSGERGSYTSSSSTSSSSPSSSCSSSTTSYLTPLPSLGDPYCTTSSECHLLDGFHGGMEPPFHKLNETSHAFQEGGYDAFISDMSHPSGEEALSNGHHNGGQHGHPVLHHPGSSILPHPHMQTVTGMNSCHDNNNGVLLLDMSNHHPPLHANGSQCSPTYICGSIPYDPLGDLCPSAAVLPHGHVHHPHLHSHHHLQDYSSNWDDPHCEPADYAALFRKGDSPSISDSISYTDNDSESKSSGGSLSGINEITHVSPPKRKVGRPPKKDKKLKRNEKKTGRLWEFIRDLLKNPEYCPSLVKWENHEEGHFRFVNSEKVAQLWGKIKGNPRMTYEKLSRAMRYYYKSHVFEPVLGRRLVYKFGYNATNWKPINNNPNFSTSHPKMYN